MINSFRSLKRIAVIGGGRTENSNYNNAYKIGGLLAQENVILVSGGKGGVMEAASRGAYDNNGLTIGILPDTNLESPNAYIGIPIYTTLGLMRNVLVIINSDLVIALEGSSGTLTEIAYAFQFSKPVIAINSWQNIPNIIQAESPEDAVKKALIILREVNRHEI